MAPEHQPRTIHTSWGSLAPAVDLAPLLYMLVLYGLVYFLPFGLFEAWVTGEDGPVNWQSRSRCWPGMTGEAPVSG